MERPINNLVCASCQYWRSQEDKYNEVLSVKRCSYVAFAPDATDWNDDYDRVIKPEFADTKAFVADASGYRATFYTRPDFGCNQHRERDNAARR